MQPVAQCLDMLQREEKAYMGSLLHNLWLMKASQEELSLNAENGDLVYAMPLVQASPRSYKKRFDHLF